MGQNDGTGSAIDKSLLRQLLEPWYSSLKDPDTSQNVTLNILLEGYRKTAYGKEHHASSVNGVEEFRRSFPISNYATFSPYIARVRNGDHEALLPEPVAAWVMTRGTTGSSKVLPVGNTHLNQILMFGARAVTNFALNGNVEVLETPVLNLNFPSEVHEIELNGTRETYGYSSGTYARIHSELMGARLLPKQEEIDALGGGITRADWEARYELAYVRTKDEDIGSLMGVTPVMVSFADYLRRKHGIWPKALWKPRALFCTSVAKIHTKYEPTLLRQYGDLPVVEMYTATEGAFAQQLDRNPYVSPNYDGYVFEVVTGSTIKMLHELRRNEWGKLVISTPILPRYDIGDLVEALGKGYFRIFGRNKLGSVVEHRLFNLLAARRLGSRDAPSEGESSNEH
jgi:hypothetical protein